MIISPPFLLERNDGEADADYVARCMPDTSVCVHDTNVPEGSFAVSFKLGWHGGLHLQAPSNGESCQNVRAVADGKIVFARKPKPTNTTPNPDEPLNYNPEGNSPAWSDDGCVVIRHETQIGADAQGQAVDVVFYSIYEHLSELRGPAIAAAKDVKEQPVWRKDEIGVAGQIYGREHQLHFEIVCDDDNLKKLINRQTGDLATGADGRNDVVFGEIYFRLPKDTPVFTKLPVDDSTQAMYGARRMPAWIRPEALLPSHVTTETYYVGLRYAAGDGAVDHRGDAYVTTCREDGEQVGDPLQELNAEYDLYLRATQISESYEEGHRPAPSAVYELLRFGRIIDTTHETLNPADMPHWRRIHTSEGDGWVNLNAQGVRKFSDADFPHWKGWKLIDDDTDADSRCESAMITRMIEDPNQADGQLTRDELLQRLGLPEVRSKLKCALCKFPSELNQDRIEEHWGWLRNDPEYGLGEKYEEFAVHVKALTIPWEKTGLPDTVWHLQPREFITAWRRCGWLSEAELRQLVPMKAVRGQGAGLHGPFFYERVPGDGSGILRRHLVPLNLMLRKFSIFNPYRLAAFIGNSVQETAWWSRMDENGGLQRSYAPWYGRGFLQLTNSNGQFTSNSNYAKYFAFLGRDVINVSASQLTTWRDAVASNDYDAANSAGAYWSWNLGNVEADISSPNTRRVMTLAANSQMRPNGTIAIYENLVFRRVACLINLPAAINSSNPQLNGLVDRYSGFANAQVVLYDLTDFPNAQGQSQPTPEDFSPRRP